MFIKLCGITRKEDVFKALGSGFNALGFIFAESKRKIEPEKAREICLSLPKEIKKTGIFLDHSFQEVERICRYCGLDTVQLHGNETWEEFKTLKEDYLLIKTFKVEDGFSNEKDLKKKIRASLRGEYFPYLLLEPLSIEGAGGTGKSFPFEILKKVPLDNIIVSGGLNTQRAETLMSLFVPWGIDMCSGMEKAPGIKDSEKMGEFGTMISLYLKNEKQKDEI